MKNILRKIILFTASSLVGYIARERGDVDWLPENLLSEYDDFLKSVDTIIMSKTPYDQILTFGDYPYQDNKSCFYSKQ
ncbi:MAG: hypothetical protein OEX98_08515 [Nitrosopumilus sp.]|nr:hypothetical protein [Nitrosopumilus sp.]MDH5569813.1 hypothetical protein [Nitrosopumilus sp.]